MPLDGPRPAEPPPPAPPEKIPEETAIGSVGKAAGDDLLSMPVNGRRTSVFGMRYHPILRIWKLHTGLDFAAPCGTPVGAAAAGRVVSSGWAGGNGVQVKVDHGMIAGYRVVTTYNHLSAIGVRVGQQVDALDGVGRVGNTGYSTGCHLHFEVIVNGRFTDPEPWLNGKPSQVDLRDIAFLDVDGSGTTPSLILGLSPSPGASGLPTASVWDSLIASLAGESSLSPSGSPSSSLSDSPWASAQPQPVDQRPSESPSARAGRPTPARSVAQRAPSPIPPRATDAGEPRRPPSSSATAPESHRRPERPAAGSHDGGPGPRAGSHHPRAPAPDPDHGVAPPPPTRQAPQPRSSPAPEPEPPHEHRASTPGTGSSAHRPICRAHHGGGRPRPARTPQLTP